MSPFTRSKTVLRTIQARLKHWFSFLLHICRTIVVQFFTIITLWIHQHTLNMICNAVDFAILFHLLIPSPTLCAMCIFMIVPLFFFFFGRTLAFVYVWVRRMSQSITIFFYLGHSILSVRWLTATSKLLLFCALNASQKMLANIFDANKSSIDSFPYVSSLSVFFPGYSVPILSNSPIRANLILFQSTNTNGIIMESEPTKPELCATHTKK